VAKFCLSDVSGEIYEETEQRAQVEIEIGWVGGPVQNVFVGEIFSVSRRLPDGTLIEAVDKSAQMRGTGSSVQVRAEQPVSSVAAQQGSTEDAAANQDSTAEATTAEATVEATVEDETAATAGVASEESEETPADAAVAATAISEDATAANDQGWNELMRVIDQLSGVLQENENRVLSGEQFAAGYRGLKYSSDSVIRSFRQGSIRGQSGQIEAAVQEGRRQGDVTVARGNTVAQVAPGKAPSSGVVLNYENGRSVFKGEPIIKKRTGLQLGGTFGAITVANWNPNDKRLVSATVVTPGPVAQHPTGVIEVPDWGSLDINQPIAPGIIYTWADATKNGSRVPTQEIMQRIVAIARVIQPLTDRTVGAGNKWRINSWYRDPASNRAAGSSSGSRHLRGDAVDFFFSGMQSLYNELNSSYVGGLAIARGSFVHIDDRGSRSRWTY
jgi:hypothetical protein